MSASEPSGRLEDLLRHQEWLRRLARALVRDERLADDLVQDTWMAAIERPPAVAGAERSWLRRVLVRRLTRLRTREAARSERERTQPLRPSPDAADDVVARAEMQQRVAQAVFALDEPYRRTVLLRYFEGLPPREIAALMSVPVETVRTRLKRALARLRDDLDEDVDPDVWRALLLPLFVEPPAPPAQPSPLGSPVATLTGGALVGTLGKTLTAAAVAVLLVAALWTVSGDPARPARAPESTGPTTDVATRPPRVDRTVPATPTQPEETLDPLGAGGPTLRVTVRDAAGRPLPGVRVDAFNHNGALVDGDWLAFIADVTTPPLPIASGRTDNAGALCIASGTGRRRVLRVSAPGHAVSVRVLDAVADDVPVDVTLRPGHALSGRVVRPDGTPIRGATVAGWPGGLNWSVALAHGRAFTRTDRDGRYRLGGLPAGPVQVFVSAPDGPPTEQGTLLVPDIDRHDIELADDGVLEGRVIDVDTGEPVPDCELMLAGPTDSRWFAPFRARSDGEGNYRVASLPRMRVRTRQTRVICGDRVFLEDPDESNGRLTISGHGPTRYDVRTRRGATVRGTVSGPDGPLPGVVASVHFGYAGTMTYRSARTDEQGRFEIAGLPATTALVELAADDHVQAGLPDQPSSAAAHDDYPQGARLEIPNTGVVLFDGRMEPGRVVSGRVVADESGAPLAGVRVSTGNGVWLRLTTTDDQGRFAVGGLPTERSFPVSLSMPGRVPRTVTVDDAAEARLERSAWVRGRVLVRGASRAGTYLDVRQVGSPPPASIRQRSVEPDGTFLLPVHGPAGTYELRALTRGGATASSGPLDVHVLERDGPLPEVEIDIRDAHDLVLRVVAAEDEAPLAGALVLRGSPDAKVRENEWRRPVYAARSGDDGRATVRGIAPETQWIRVDVAGRTSFEGAIEGATSGEVVVRLARAPEIPGRVLAADGTPAAHASVTAQRDGRSVDATYTAVDGSFTLRPGDGGAVTVEARPRSNERAAPAIAADVSAGGDALELRLGATRAVLGRVVDARGQPLAGLPVVLRRGRTDIGRRTTDADGRFAFEAVTASEAEAEAEAEVALEANDERRLAEPVAVSATGDADVILTASRGAMIRGRVRRRDGSPVAGARLSVDAHARLAGDAFRFGDSAVTTTDDQGTFETWGLLAGTYAVKLVFLDGVDVETLVLNGARDVQAGGPPVDLVLDAGTQLRGRVVPPTAGPVSGSVSAVGAVPGVPSRNAVLQDDGTFVLIALLPGVPYRLEVEARNCALHLVDVVPGGEPLEDVRLPDAPVTSAVLVDPEGRPVPDRQFILRGARRAGSGRTDADGRLVVTGLAAGSYDVEVAIPFDLGEIRGWEFRKMGAVRSGEDGGRITVEPPRERK